jgi:hypothetical protein
VDKIYDTLKQFNNKVYTGMKIGNSHIWNYKNGIWRETKLTPDKWEFSFNSMKTRTKLAPKNTGAKINTKFHWYILADQLATKINNNSYMTSMKGFKFKVGHKRPNWKSFSYDYPEQNSYKERVISFLENVITEIKNGKLELVDPSEFQAQTKPVIFK